MNEINNLSIGIVAGIFETNIGSYHTIYNNLTYILSNFVRCEHIISSNALLEITPLCDYKYYNIYIRKRPLHPIGIILRRIYAELKYSIEILRISNQISGPIFFLSGEVILPVIIARILHKKTMLVAVASASNNVRNRFGNSIRGVLLSKIVKINELISWNVSSYVGVESPNVAKFMNISIPTSRLIANEPLYLHNPIFTNKIPYSERPFCIGYIGRFSSEKGILEFISSLRGFLDVFPEYSVSIVGNGPLQNEVHTYITKNGLENNVNICGWIDHNHLPNILNKFRLLVLPSYTEGLPNILLESMACGTPVLGTSVGGVPDVIENNINGFLVKNNDPSVLSSELIRILSLKNLETISDTALHTINERYSQSSVIKRWLDIVQNM